MTEVFRSVRRLQRDQWKTRGPGTLNLVPLMDVFTILVFFFLVHSAEVGPITEGTPVDLPESVAQQTPRPTLVIVLTEGDILLRGRSIAPVSRVLQDPGSEIPALAAALQEERKRDGGQGGAAAGEVTVMGDKSIPFRLLNKVMLTCTRAGFGRIALSVVQRPTGQG